MQGHLDIIRMRQERMKPDFVFVNDFLCQTDWFEFGEYATVSIDPKEAIELLDMRFLTGLKVSVTSMCEKRSKALFKACIAAGAKTVAACHCIPGQSPFKATGWTEIFHAPEKGAV